MVFGIDSGTRYDRLRELLTTLLDTFNNPLNSSIIFFPWMQKDLGKYSPWGRFIRIKQEIRALIYAEIKDRRKAIESRPIGIPRYLQLVVGSKRRDRRGHERRRTS